MPPPCVRISPRCCARLLHLGADRRAGARPASSRCRGASAIAGTGDRAHAAADLPLRAAADGVPHHHPAADRESMNIIKNSSVALTVGVAELTVSCARDAGVHASRCSRRSRAATIDLHRLAVTSIVAAACACSSAASPSRASSAQVQIPRAMTRSTFPSFTSTRHRSVSALRYLSRGLDVHACS